MLSTGQDLVRRSLIESRPEYEDVEPLDSDDHTVIGLRAYRPYPSGTALSRVITPDGRPAVRCGLTFVIQAGITRVVEVRTWLARWKPQEVFSSDPDYYDPKPGDPKGPSPQSL